ncbi:hypothetical protein EW026_g4363 [Hermanssonia centrifuga]|uniref:TAP42-like protein n=1 Tax=Hermanssonia centrifuga TaxID=98765 RepID=A0A4S4KJ48_9APHY|nr:hypothetical protein EW026_g4363 [Hermanssonia centrifuga]
MASLSLFSPNETLADISSRDLVFLFVPFVVAELENRARTTSPQGRIEHIGRAQAYLREFLSQLETYEVVPVREKALYEQRASSVADPAKRRELKIKQYQKEKELRVKIEAVRKARRQSLQEENPSSDFELIASLLPSSTMNDSTDEEEDSETEDLLRESILLLLVLMYTQAHNQLESMDQELELLRSMPPPPPLTEEDARSSKGKEKDDMWKLDSPMPSGGPDGKGPLMDDSGKLLRPFTILPAGAADRARLQAEVFQPDHRLPTMSIDEYLEIEQQRGNIITGGGPQSQSKLTTSEQLQLDSEMDGTIFAEQRTEEKRQKDENWARYTDTHPKGAGNTMNRG